MTFKEKKANLIARLERERDEVTCDEMLKWMLNFAIFRVDRLEDEDDIYHFADDCEHAGRDCALDAAFEMKEIVEESIDAL
jgi:hypothetical protein